MADILKIERVCDGTDVTCELVDGRKNTFHFRIEPKDIQASVNELELKKFEREQDKELLTEEEWHFQQFPQPPQL